MSHSKPFEKMNPDHILVRNFASGIHENNGFVTSNNLAAALNIQIIEARSGPGSVVLRCQPGALFLQGAGRVQGGAISSILDFAMSFSAMADFPGEFLVATIAMNVSFIRAAPQAPLHAEGWIDQATRSLVFTQATLKCVQSGDLIATAASTLAVRKSEPVTEYV
jgi:uncharacterized protein (TIGR00369 family)